MNASTKKYNGNGNSQRQKVFFKIWNQNGKKNQKQNHETFLSRTLSVICVSFTLIWFETKKKTKTNTFDKQKMLSQHSQAYPLIALRVVVVCPFFATKQTKTKLKIITHIRITVWVLAERVFKFLQKTRIMKQKKRNQTSEARISLKNYLIKSIVYKKKKCF